jgi:hypothetical protein
VAGREGARCGVRGLFLSYGLPNGSVGCLYERGEKSADEKIVFDRFKRD